MQRSKLEREVRALKVYAATSTFAFAVLILGAFAPGARRERFTEIDVERINIVEADGSRALIIANTARMPGPVLEGRELPRSMSQGREGSAGLIFVSSAGDEVGGLVYGVRRTAQGFRAGGILTFDQYNQDQVVGLSYADNGTSRSQGLSVWDRSTTSTNKEQVALFEARARLMGPARDSVQRRIDELARSGGFGAHRVFVGSSNRTAGLRIKDTRGRERIRIYVDSTNVARMELLDENGAVTPIIPGTDRP